VRLLSFLGRKVPGAGSILIESDIGGTFVISPTGDDGQSGLSPLEMPREGKDSFAEEEEECMKASVVVRKPSLWPIAFSWKIFLLPPECRRVSFLFRKHYGRAEEPPFLSVPIPRPKDPNYNHFSFVKSSTRDISHKLRD